MDGKSERATSNAKEIVASVQRSIDQGAIAKRAYEIYLARGATHGRDIEDWLQAESELADSENDPSKTSAPAGSAAIQRATAPAVSTLATLPRGRLSRGRRPR